MPSGFLLSIYILVYVALEREREKESEKGREREREREREMVHINSYKFSCVLCRCSLISSFQNISMLVWVGRQRGGLE
jgi:hypothetical protein